MSKIVFMGTPAISVPALEAISKNFNVVAVYTQPDRPVGRGLEIKQSAIKICATRLGISVKQPEKINVPPVIDELKSFSPDFIVVSAYAHLLKKEILSLPKLGCVNIHFSLLPRWRGAAPVQYSILEGDAETGVTAMFMSEGLDEGDILRSEKCPILAAERSDQLAEKLSLMAAPLIVSTLQGLEQGAIKTIRQDHSQATYARKLNKDLQWIVPSLTTLEVDRRVRALYPWPGTSIRIEGAKRIKVLEGKAWLGKKASPGQLQDLNGMLVLGLSDGVYEITRLQLDGKKPQESGVFLNGLKGQGRSLPLSFN